MSSIKNSGCWPTKSQVCARSYTQYLLQLLQSYWDLAILSLQEERWPEGGTTVTSSLVTGRGQSVGIKQEKRAPLRKQLCNICFPGMRSLRSTIFETSAVRSSVSAQMISGFSRSSLPLRPGTTFRTSCSPLSVSGRWSVWSGSLHFQSECAR